ncbi:hypothetical protein C8F04DRAFT_970323 [Mycena alexandri]|uniref:Uncharacterized protein n=1 Tax=Mycena alexandri TaxID=1745969 RepID=A0AAD6S8T1_9AGAR|nr:hypothetical protein C8F04DRAFT_978746 [Mycena alexandri]KAJ7023296.1 hypothetical protein C8F04DRAFT_970323 [Mycena alexandri]
MDGRPDRPLLVKCTFDRWKKRITFTSARNCSYDLLRHKVEQCFSLYATSFVIAYKDDDGEVTDMSTDSDLTEAIQYFQAGTDDPPLSSAASILSGRSFGSRKSNTITLRVNITVDYDGPSLSDTSSLASMEEYRDKNRNGSQQSFSFGAPSVDLDDDSITVSSRDAISRAERPVHDGGSQASAQSWDLMSQPSGEQAGPSGPSTTLRYHSNASDPFADEAALPVSDPPADPSAVFERLKLEESIRDDSSSVNYDNLDESDRGAAWLRDQNARTIRSMLGALPEPSVSSGVSSIPEEEEEELAGALALEQDPRGKYYYSYTSSSTSQSRESGFYTRDSGYYGEGVNLEGQEEFRQPKPRPSSRQLNWLAAHQAASQPQPQPIPKPPRSTSDSTDSHQSHGFDHSPDHSYTTSNTSIPREVLQFLPLNPPASETLTDCSECGVLLDSIRYVCSICGEKKPASHYQYANGHDQSHQYPNSFQVPHEPEYSYPPRPHQLGSSPSSSRTFLAAGGSSESLTGSMRHFKPLPRLPAHGPSPSVFSSQVTLVVPPDSGSMREETGYELCSGCIEHAGVTHAIEAGLSPGSASPSASPLTPEDAQRALEWRRLAPKKGQTRHAYHEKVWGHLGWEDVEQDETQIHKCSTCTAITTHHRYKCASCMKFNLCRACYSQVHDLHPSHAFLVVPDLSMQTNSESDFFETVPPGIGAEGEKSLTHPGVRCAHCMLDIVGARFHCAICDAVDICANCESAGLPGNLDSSEGGHTSSHILIKIPYPLETDEVQTASRRAIHLWQGRDAASVGHQPPKPSKASSVISSYARTVIGSGTRLPPDEDHHIFCHGCGHNIVGVRYQCANCPSSPQGFSLCSDCEEHSYSLHDPSHIFFKFPRPVQRPLVSSFTFLPKLYKSPAGPPPGMDSRTYLSSIEHSAALCDRCMSGIQGVWFRCAYCGVDYCDACEAVDTHNDSHCFMVFKSPVDMQALKSFAPIENPPPVIPYPVYR